LRFAFRVRKKARYQELLDTEQKYLELQDDEELSRKRRQAVVAFLDARTEMLGQAVKSTAGKSLNNSGEGGAGKSENKENIAMSFDTHTESSIEDKGIYVVSRPRQIIWGDFLDEDNFRFESSLVSELEWAISYNSLQCPNSLFNVIYKRREKLMSAVSKQ